MVGRAQSMMTYGARPVADGVTLKIEGLDEVIAKTKSLSHDIQYKGGRFALRKAANLVADAAKKNADRVDDPGTAESIKENIAVRFSTRMFRSTGNVGFRVGVLGGARAPATAVGELKGAGSRNPGGDTFYWRFIEFGTESISARPFMRPALSQNVDNAIAEFVKQYGPAIDRALKRAKK